MAELPKPPKGENHIMFKYKAFGLVLLSDIELPGMMETATNDKVDIQISLEKINLPLLGVPPGSNYIVDHNDVYLWWEDVGKVQITNGEKIIVDVEAAEENQIKPFILGPSMAIILHQRGFLVLHGSSVKIEQGAIAFLGYRGVGKSTIAIHLYKKGYPFITDDILAINFDEEEKPIVYPGYPHTRLSVDTYNNIKDITPILNPIRTIAGKNFYDVSRGFYPEPIS